MASYPTCRDCGSELFHKEEQEMGRCFGCSWMNEETEKAYEEMREMQMDEARLCLKEEVLGATV